MNATHEIWNQILVLLREELSQTAVDTWFSSAELVDLDNNSAVICAANDLAREVMSKRFESPIKKALENLFCQEFLLTFISGDEQKQRYLAHKDGREGFKALTIPAYSFEDFVVGETNRFAFGIAETIAEHPEDRNYNPVFIYGPAGTGKTHLLCATALRIHEKYPGKKIEYISGDEFTNRLVSAIQNHTTEQFREEYRRADVLLIDNVQFIVGKPATQEEFYNTFNALHDAGKLIVMASDTAPREMPVIESRMRTRFESGIMADIGAPDEQLRFDVLRTKCSGLGISLSEEDLRYFASKKIGSIRQLEGLVKSLSAYQRIFGSVTRREIDEVLSKSVFESDERITPEDILFETARFYDVSPSDLKGASRARQVSTARQVAMYLMRMTLGMTLEEIGVLFRRDHATVINSVKKIETLSRKDENIMKAITAIRKKITGKVA